MSKSNVFEAEILDLFFQSTVAGTIATALGWSTGGVVNLHVSLHTDDPGEGGNQATNEVLTANWSTYARVAVSQNDWTATGNTATNDRDIAFAQKTDSGSVTVTHFGIGTAASGTGGLMYSGPLATEDSQPFTVDDSLSNDNIICPGHGFAADDQINFIDVEGATLPTEITPATEPVYYVQSVTDVDRFTIALTAGAGSAIALTNGSGRVVRMVQKVVNQNDTLTITAGNLVVKED